MLDLSILTEKEKQVCLTLANQMISGSIGLVQGNNHLFIDFCIKASEMLREVLESEEAIALANKSQILLQTEYPNEYKGASVNCETLADISFKDMNEIASLERLAALKSKE